MSRCSRCQCVFKFPSLLRRHELRKYQCVEVEKGCENLPGVKKDSLGVKKDSLGVKKNMLGVKKDSLKNTTCKYCLNDFCNQRYRKKHEINCKQNNETRTLELEMNVNPQLPESKTECRFCNKVLSRNTYLNKHYEVCKEREKYHMQLIQEQKQVIQTQNIQTQNNVNNVNNVNINFFGEASDNHIMKTQLTSLLSRLIKYENAYEAAGELAGEYCHLMYLEDSNKNISINDMRSTYGEVETEDGKKMMLVSKIMDTVLRTTADKINKRLTDLKEDGRPFKKEIANKIDTEINNFKKTGFKHYYNKKERDELYNNLLVIFTG